MSTPYPSDDEEEEEDEEEDEEGDESEEESEEETPAPVLPAAKKRKAEAAVSCYCLYQKQFAKMVV